MPGLSWISLAVGDEISHRLPVPCSEWNCPHRDKTSHPTQLKAASPCDLTCWHSTGGHYTLHRLRQWANSVGYYCMSVWLWSSLAQVLLFYYHILNEWAGGAGKSGRPCWIKWATLALFAVCLSWVEPSVSLERRCEWLWRLTLWVTVHCKGVRVGLGERGLCRQVV